jgi:hypothetical protein
MRQLFLRWTIALPYLMRSHLLDYHKGSDSLEELLLDAEVCPVHAHVILQSALQMHWLRGKHCAIYWCVKQPIGYSLEMAATACTLPTRPRTCFALVDAVSTKFTVPRALAMRREVTDVS